MSKLAIGTVQFGMPYGVANSVGQVSLDEASEILTLARKEGVDTLDTAIAYGESERVLGQIGVDDYQVITKLPSMLDNEIDVFKWVERQVESSLKKLKQKEIYGLLLHKPCSLKEKNGDALYQALIDLKSQGLIKKIGVSIYSPSELDLVLNDFDIDLVQAPVNLFDRSMESTGIGKQLKEKGIEVHARSIFLQGLLLMKPESRPKKFSRWHKVFEVFGNWLAANNKTALEATLKYVDQLSFVDKLIVGVDSKLHLEQILAALNSGSVDIPVFFDHKDTRLINPSRWSEL